MRCLLRATLIMSSLITASVAMIACSGQGTSPQSVTITPMQSGPNANLSNSDLLHEAVSNTRTLNSYNLDLVESESLKLRINADVQPIEKGRKFQGEKEDGSSSEYLIMTKEGNYVSHDRGKTWYKPEVDTGFAFVMPLVFPLSDRNMQGQDTYISEEFINSLQIKDGDPPTEIVDGIFTRHMIADTATIMVYPIVKATLGQN